MLRYYGTIKWLVDVMTTPPFPSLPFLPYRSESLINSTAMIYDLWFTSFSNLTQSYRDVMNMLCYLDRAVPCRAVPCRAVPC